MYQYLTLKTAAGLSHWCRISTTAAKEPKLLDSMCSFFTPTLASSNCVVENNLNNQMNIFFDMPWRNILPFAGTSSQNGFVFRVSCFLQRQ
jgi:hypothetical protein